MTPNSAQEETLYKLTDPQGVSYERTTGSPFAWGEGVTHTVPFCERGWIHAVPDPLLAVLFHPLHAQIEKPILWKCTGIVGIRGDRIKIGCRSLTTHHRMPLPDVTLEQRVRFAILCAQQVYREESWNRWADRWLEGSAQDSTAADGAAYAAYVDHETAVAAKGAAYAAKGAAYAAYVGDETAVPAEAAEFAAAYAAAGAAAAAANAAAANAVNAANAAADATAERAFPLDLCALARQALETP